MDFNECFYYATEGFEYFSKGGFFAYIVAMLSNPASLFFSKRIDTQGELDDIVREESLALGMDDIKGILKDEFEMTSYVDFSKDKIIEVGGFAASRSGVRHELYHHFKGDILNSGSSSFVETLKYLAFQEPRACLYQSMKIKL